MIFLIHAYIRLASIPSTTFGSMPTRNFGLSFSLLVVSLPTFGIKVILALEVLEELV